MDMMLIYKDWFKDVNQGYEDVKFRLDARKDPDKLSVGLYQALKEQFYKDDITLKHEIKEGCGKDKYYSLYEIEDEKLKYILSSDYIGPSIYNASIIAKLDEIEIKRIISLGRTLGGHMLWCRNLKVYREDTEKRWITLHYDYDDKNQKPKYYYNLLLNVAEIENFKKEKIEQDKLEGGKWQEQPITINNQRGGEYKLYDRFDWTLLLLKIYFELLNDENIETNEKINVLGKDKYLERCLNYLEKQLLFEDENIWELKNRISSMYYAFDNSREWLREFENFQKFSIFFKLYGTFVSTDFQVNMFTAIFPVKPENYKEYIKNNIQAIFIRNANL